MIRVGISSCLLGEEVRYDGGHKRSRLCRDALGRYFDYVPLCPEVGIGMGIPRDPIRLVGDPQAPRAVGVEDPAHDVTDDLKNFARQQLPGLADICGYIFMQGSPSCGLFRVRVYRGDGQPHEAPGRGIFAHAITQSRSLLPVEEAGRLQDPVLRENFIARVFAYANWQELKQAGLTAAGLVDFHSRYKYMLMATNSRSYTELGRMVSEAGRHDPEELGERYFAALMTALTCKASRKSHTNVLMHLQGYLGKHLDSSEKRELTAIIEQYRLGSVPLIVPISLLKHHFNNHPDEYISRQAYLQPYPDDLGLRNLI